MIDETLLDAEDRMEKAVDAARGEFGNIRSGRANAAMFTSILVDYYGAPTPLRRRSGGRGATPLGGPMRRPAPGDGTMPLCSAGWFDASSRTPGSSS